RRAAELHDDHRTPSRHARRRQEMYTSQRPMGCATMPRMSASSTTVIIGAGFGGAAAARRLRTLLPKEHRVLVVDRRSEVSLGAGHSWVLTGRKGPEHVTRRLSNLTRHGLEFRCAEVMGIDPIKRVVEIAGDKVTADALVVATGAQLTLEPLPGASGVAHQFYELDAALR